jgi:hypothetical protein
MSGCHPFGPEAQSYASLFKNLPSSPSLPAGVLSEVWDLSHWKSSPETATATGPGLVLHREVDSGEVEVVGTKHKSLQLLVCRGLPP